MADSRVFVKRDGITIEGIGRCVQNFLHNSKGLTVQGGKVNDNGYVVQAMQDSGWRKISGMDNAVEVQISDTGTNILVNIGNAKWADKIGAGVIGMFVFAPLAVTAAVGSYQQTKLPGEIFEQIERYIMSGGQDLYAGANLVAAGAGMQICPMCKSEVAQGKQFCTNCGFALSATCPTCGASMPLGIKFCSACGKSMSITKTVTCSACGNECSEGAAFCIKCGAKLAAEAPSPMPVPAAAPAAKICAKCGAENEPDDMFCAECGEPLTPPAPETKTCPSCSGEVKASKPFCPKCGYKF